MSRPHDRRRGGPVAPAKRLGDPLESLGRFLPALQPALRFLVLDRPEVLDGLRDRLGTDRERMEIMRMSEGRAQALGLHAEEGGTRQPRHRRRGKEDGGDDKRRHREGERFRGRILWEEGHAIVMRLPTAIA